MSSSLTLKHARYVITILLIAFATTYFISLVMFFNNPPDMMWVDNIDGMYEASASILALVGFGSTIGVKISANKLRAQAQLAGLLLVFGGSGLVIMTQVIIMMGLCCIGLHQLLYVIFLVYTGLCLLVMLLGYLALVIQQHKEDDVDAMFKREANDKIKSFVASDTAPASPTDPDMQNSHISKAPVPWNGPRY